MSNQKKFGVWMDNHHASVAGEGEETGSAFTILGHVEGEVISPNSNEKNSNNHAKTIQGKFFKEIAGHFVNATHLHITGTGQVQEQFIHYLAETPQFKNCKMEESTSNKMSDEKLLEYLAERM